MLVHLDDVPSVDDGDPRARRRAERGPDGLLAPDKHEIRDATLRPVQQRAPNHLVRGVVTTHRVDRDAHRYVLLGVRFLVRILITCRPRYMPQCGQAWCGGFGLLHWGQGTRFVARSRRWLRRSPCAACGVRFLGSPANSCTPSITRR